MIEIVFSAPDIQTLQSEAVRLGFVDPNGALIRDGSTQDGGSWTLVMHNQSGDLFVPTGATVQDENGNDVPVMEQQPGVWGRLRVNGSGTGLPQFSNVITQYFQSASLGGWTADGTTLAPSWVADVALIL